ncbi:DUF4198 domain-containing protein [Photobacterium sanguinicancri]|uniref:DUF4198 domain-containing protein n=1 Tax=Photobacterium sanguinicancri TaxID=875932 RepID=A0ABX4FYA9_9GAMM|nr:DUF4198 domain-containing protein [Photobacterium sanguinicancri]KXI21656.1 nickel transporter [Photobacterium sanguinicancri]MDO6500673.1 DUF4198 domain-containing protein [Photobacterium sanguinicancri]OZS43818.1 DUF4198 domain-containing protein [Photobacterium sanguinicancri]
MKKTTLALLGAATLSFSAASHAHFQMAYTPEMQLAKPATLDMKLVFGHPMENGHVMDMEKPLEFFVQFKDKRTDLMSKLKEISWQGPENKAKAYQADVKVQRNGDYIFAVVPTPYYEKNEDVYIQQITKSFVNKGAMPTGWEEPLGLKTEILPLNKPYQVFAGGTFSGKVISDGKPVAGAECEIEFVNTDINLEKNAFGKTNYREAPASAIVAFTDDNGVFTFGIPKAGTWGFACLGTGPDTEYQGKELSQDAVIWVQAKEL